MSSKIIANIVLYANFSDFTICKVRFKLFSLRFDYSAQILEMSGIFMLPILDFPQCSVGDNHRCSVVFTVCSDHEEHPFAVTARLRSDHRPELEASFCLPCHISQLLSEVRDRFREPQLYVHSERKEIRPL